MDFGEEDNSPPDPPESVTPDTRTKLSKPQASQVASGLVVPAISVSTDLHASPFRPPISSTYKGEKALSGNDGLVSWPDDPHAHEFFSATTQPTQEVLDFVLHPRTPTMASNDNVDDESVSSVSSVSSITSSDTCRTPFDFMGLADSVDSDGEYYVDPLIDEFIANANSSELGGR